MFAIFKVTKENYYASLVGTADTHKAAVTLMAKNLQHELQDYKLKKGLHDHVPSIGKLTRRDYTFGEAGAMTWELKRTEGSCYVEFNIDNEFSAYQILEVTNAKYSVVKVDMECNVFLVSQADDKSQAEQMLHDQVLQNLRDYYLSHIHVAERVPGIDTRLGLAECSDEQFEAYQDKIDDDAFDDIEDEMYYSICEMPD